MSPAKSVLSFGGASSFKWVPQGCGLGLRHQHYPMILETMPKVDWFEAITENFMDSGGRPIQILEKVRQHYPIALHGTALSLGSTDPLNKQYLERLKKLTDRIDPFIVSDHLCWSSVQGEVLHDLLPLPLTEEALKHVVRRIDELQNYLKRPFVIENVSSYVTYRESTMTEWEFMAEAARRSGCGLLVDLNNVYVNSKNHGFDPMEYLKGIPASHLAQIHLAGHTDMGEFLFDTHSAPIIDKVWKLYEEALKLWGPVSTLIEWDEHIPALDKLIQEADKAKAIYRRYEKQKPSAAKIEPPKKRAAAGALPLEKIQILFKSRMQAFDDADRDEKTNVSIDKLLNPQGGVAASERMSVYANGYPARVHESMTEVFEAVRLIVGADKFFDLAYAYAHSHARDDADYNMNFVGRAFPEFLKHAPDAEKLPFLPDLARLEWLTWTAFHAFDEKALTAKDTASVKPKDWESARFIFQPSVSAMESEWEIFNIWKERSSGKVFKTKTAKNKEYLLVGRNGEKVRCEKLDEYQYALLTGLLAGKKLGEVCEALAEEVDDPSKLNISGWFASWVALGFIQGLQIGKKRVAA